MKLSKKTLSIMSMVMLSSLFLAGCSDTVGNDEEYDDQSMIDDNGDSYVLHHNENGTETANYEDGKSVTFKKDDDGNLSPVAGTAGLLGGLAAGYFLFHGYNNNGGYYDNTKNKYISNDKPQKIDRDDRNKQFSSYVPATTAMQAAASSAKSSEEGFGSAGARSAAS